VSSSASDRSALSNLNAALTDAKAVHAAAGTFPTDLAVQPEQTEPTLPLVPAPAVRASPGTANMASTSQAVLVTDRSPSATCDGSSPRRPPPSGVGRPGHPSAAGISLDSSPGLTRQASAYPNAG